MYNCPTVENARIVEIEVIIGWGNAYTLEIIHLFLWSMLSKPFKSTQVHLAFFIDKSGFSV